MAKDKKLGHRHAMLTELEHRTANETHKTSVVPPVRPEGKSVVENTTTGHWSARKN